MSKALSIMIKIYQDFYPTFLNLDYVMSINIVKEEVYYHYIA